MPAALPISLRVRSGSLSWCLALLRDAQAWLRLERRPAQLGTWKQKGKNGLLVPYIGQYTLHGFPPGDHQGRSHPSEACILTGPTLASCDYSDGLRLLEPASPQFCRKPGPSSSTIMPLFRFPPLPLLLGLGLALEDRGWTIRDIICGCA